MLYLRSWPDSGSARSSRRASRSATPRCACSPSQGFAATTIDQIAEAADVSRATVFTYFPTKEEIVFGEAAAAIEGLAARLRERPDDESTIAAVRAWLGELAGWLEPELRAPAAARPRGPGRRRPPAAALRRHRARHRRLARAELGPEQQLAARLRAASLVAGLASLEETAAARLSDGGHGLGAAETERILDVTIGYLKAGLSAVAQHEP